MCVCDKTTSQQIHILQKLEFNDNSLNENDFGHISHHWKRFTEKIDDVTNFQRTLKS